MSTAPAPDSRELNAQTANLVERLRSIGQQKKALTDDEKELKAQLRTLGAGRWTFDGRPVLDLQEGLQWDPELAEAILPEDVKASLRVEVLDRAKAAEVLAPALYRACCRAKETAVKPL